MFALLFVHFLFFENVKGFAFGRFVGWTFGAGHHFFALAELVVAFGYAYVDAVGGGEGERVREMLGER